MKHIFPHPNEFLNWWALYIASGKRCCLGAGAKFNRWWSRCPFKDGTLNSIWVNHEVIWHHPNTPQNYPRFREVEGLRKEILSRAKFPCRLPCTFFRKHSEGTLAVRENPPFNPTVSGSRAFLCEEPPQKGRVFGVVWAALASTKSTSSLDGSSFELFHWLWLQMIASQQKHEDWRRTILPQHVPTKKCCSKNRRYQLWAKFPKMIPCKLPAVVTLCYIYLGN